MSQKRNQKTRGRGAGGNPAGRFERLEYVPDPDAVDPSGPGKPATEFLRDTSRSIITTNDSPDVGFDAGINPYRGCEHGCIYCYARPMHEYLGFSAGLDFETKILVKENAPELLRAALSSPRWTPRPVGISGATDPYQPAERRLGLTRVCLEVLSEFRNPAVVVTKNHLVTRDIDLLSGLARHDAAQVCLSVTTLDPDLARVMEPRTSTPRKRLEAISALRDAGVPVGVLVAPVVPGLTEHELPAIVDAAAQAGASFAGYIVLRLPHGVKDLFTQWLREHFPEREKKVLNRIRDIRGGALNDSDFATRGRGTGAYAAQIRSMFDLAVRRAGISNTPPPVSAKAFRRPDGDQFSLFED